jgi:hypothetical protein
MKKLSKKQHDILKGEVRSGKTFMHILRIKHDPNDFIEASDTFTDDDLANGEETIEINNT